MNKYFISVFVIATLISVLRLIGYRFGSTERLALGIICLYVIASPLRSVGQMNFDSVLDTPSIEVENGADEVLREAMSRGIASAVSDEFDIDEKDISVRLFGFSAETMTSSKIEVILSGSAVSADYRSIESFVNKMKVGECTVEISF